MFHPRDSDMSVIYCVFVVGWIE